jgi:hypothetical protein
MRELETRQTRSSQARKTPNSRLDSVVRSQRRRQRGAAMIEAVLVFSVFILVLIGMVYFRALYVKKLGAQRMARAAVIAHSMAGCKENPVRNWLSRDGNGYRIVGSQPSRTSIPNQKGTAEPSAGSEPESLAPRLLGSLGRASNTTSDGKGILNPITDARVNGDVEVAPRAGVLDKGGFRGEVGSQSFLSCGDEVKTGDYGAIIDVIKDELATLNNAK